MLHWTRLPGATMNYDSYQEGDTRLGIYGHYVLYAAAGQEREVPKFARFVLATATQSDTITTGGAGGGGGGAGGGGGNVSPKSFFNIQVLPSAGSPF